MHVLTHAFDAEDIIAQVKFPLHELENCWNISRKMQVLFTSMNGEGIQEFSSFKLYK